MRFVDSFDVRDWHDVPLDDRTYLVIVTRDHAVDQQLLEAVIGYDLGYLGMIGSRRKVEMFKRRLEAKGVPPERFARLHAPIGIDIHAETPEEIAVAIVAELIQVRAAPPRSCAQQGVPNMSITAVILAAGASRRMGGSPKALIELQGETYLTRITRTARAAGATNVLVVAGPPHGERVRARLPVGAAVIWNPDPGRGMFSSVQTGVAGLPRGTLSALVWPVDQPLVREDTVRRVLAAQPGRIAIPRYQGRGGHPVRIPVACFGPLLALPVEATLKDLIDRQAALRVDVDVDDAWVVQDVDTPEEALAAAAAEEKR